MTTKPSGKCCALDALGMSLGILLAWDPVLSYFKSFSTVVGHVVEGKFLGFDTSIRILNVYEPYNKK